MDKQKVIDTITISGFDKRHERKLRRHLKEVPILFLKRVWLIRKERSFSKRSCEYKTEIARYEDGLIFLYKDITDYDQIHVVLSIFGRMIYASFVLPTLLEVKNKEYWNWWLHEDDFMRDFTKYISAGILKRSLLLQSKKYRILKELLQCLDT